MEIDRKDPWQLFLDEWHHWGGSVRNSFDLSENKVESLANRGVVWS